MSKHKNVWLLSLCIIALLSVDSWAQSVNASLSGMVTDPSGAVVPDADLTLTSLDTAVVARSNTGPDGLYSFPNLQVGTYELKVSAKGFRDFVQRGIRLLLNEKVRQDVKLELGAETQTIEVQADASALNYETAEQKGGIAPETVGELPLLVAGNARSAAGFVILLPGVTSPTGSVLDTHINGGQQGGGEGMLDGVSLVDPSGGNGIWSSVLRLHPVAGYGQ